MTAFFYAMQMTGLRAGFCAVYYKAQQLIYTVLWQYFLKRAEEIIHNITLAHRHSSEL
jgi:hypothetical protein